MHMFKQKSAFKKLDDPALVLASIGGDKEAFCEIVSRYQNLLCSVAYASLGDLKQSEDIAQDVFVEAWQKLDTLRDPAKLKSWLCGILRFKISNHCRSEKNQAIKNADDIDALNLSKVSESSMEDQAIDKEQQNLLWNTLSTIDVNYREPLVLFYREQQSVENVANQLDLNIDTAKQRLSRGRKLLKKAMTSIMEEALEKSKPGAVFTAGVFIVLEDVSKHTAAAVIGASSIKTSSFFKSTSLITIFAAFSGVISSFFGLKASLYQSRTENERKLAKKVFMLFMSFAAIFVGSMYGLQFLSASYQHYNLAFAVSSQILVLGFVISYLMLMSMIFKTVAELRAQERIFYPEAFAREVDKQSSKKREYKSSLHIFGYPLVHFKFGTPEINEPAAKGWIAGGSKAYGLLFAWGGLAVAPVSVGIISVGVITCGAVGVGIFSIGTVAIGIVAFGASAVAYKAYASLSALGWESAFSNGFSMAKEAAIGPVAYASEVNNEAANALSNMTVFGEHYQWILITMAAFVIVPAYLHFNQVRERMK
ncbi:RNA polymerase sigma factor [Glaciecola petra]|uniref:RNA polymerase sigma factor n=1 Tax=Glaciecola petra TaxID=3075602 RepID=A0ABU2ZRC7_9ALTE|nr:sigma-70 family RNA polymerase sigma factor [Aestuariibacter sp. P117]MDT0594965.1 sigma-70 family RNA polymerase sigma factor [Aestuariibacter sp. P117]